MNITSIPGLENIAAAKIAIQVCNNLNVLKLNNYLEEKLSYIFDCETNNKQWKKLEANISRKISSLGLPKALQKKINGIIRPVLLEIEQWKEDHCEILGTHINLQRNFCWNQDGTINRKKTACALIKLENFDIRNRFVLACFYFLEDDILTLWQKLSSCYEENSVYDASASLIVRFWVKRLKGHGMDLESLASECVLYPPPAIFPQNAMVFNSFLHLLPASDKLQCLIFQINRRLINRNDMFLCLSMCTESELILIFDKCAMNILRHFVNWPLQNHFLDMADTLWPYLPKNHFLNLLQFILRRRIERGWSDFDYIGLLKEFWLSSPSDFKEYVEENNYIFNHYNFFESLMEAIYHDRTKPFPKERWHTKSLLCTLSFFKALRLSCTRSRMQAF